LLLGKIKEGFGLGDATKGLMISTAISSPAINPSTMPGISSLRLPNILRRHFPSYRHYYTCPPSTQFCIDFWIQIKLVFSLRPTLQHDLL